MDKRALRRRLRDARSGLPRELVAGWSAAMASRLAALDVWREASVLHCYVGSLPGEALTDPLIARALAEGKRVLAPCVRPHGQLEHRELTSLAQVGPAQFGLREPRPELAPPAGPDDAELIVVPGVAFAEDGARLGMGGGYYDRFLAGQDALRVGLAFEMQLTPPQHIPRAEHDQSVDLIVTELRVIRCD